MEPYLPCQGLGLGQWQGQGQGLGQGLQSLQSAMLCGYIWPCLQP